MGNNLQRLARRHKDSLLRANDPAITEALGNVLKLTKPTIEEFDEAYTRIGGGPAPRWPYKSAEDYYVDNSSSLILHQVQSVDSI